MRCLLGGGATRRLLLRRGAEADILLEEVHGLRAIVKRRTRKEYRNPQLDDRLRVSRTSREAQMIHEAKSAGVATPCIYEVDVSNATIVMEFVDGPRLKEALEGMSSGEKKSVLRLAGSCVGKLHRHNITHGDLTTSNMLLYAGRVCLIDFGLAARSVSLEDKGVDILLMKRSLYATHTKDAAELYGSFHKGYASVVGLKEDSSLKAKVDEIERRGRYRERYG